MTEANVLNTSRGLQSCNQEECDDSDSAISDNCDDFASTSASSLLASVVDEEDDDPMTLQQHNGSIEYSTYREQTNTVLPEDEQVCTGSHISAKTGIALISQLVQRHNLSKAALSDILSVLSAFLPEQPRVLRSLYMFNKAIISVLGMSPVDIIVHTLCPKCQSLLSPDENQCTAVGCTYDGRQKKITFMELPIDKQLQSMFSG